MILPGLPTSQRVSRNFKACVPWVPSASRTHQDGCAPQTSDVCYCVANFNFTRRLSRRPRLPAGRRTLPHSPCPSGCGGQGIRTSDRGVLCGEACTEASLWERRAGALPLAGEAEADETDVTRKGCTLPCAQERRLITGYFAAFSRWKCVLRPAPGPG
jgi:hypothetical protein